MADSIHDIPQRHALQAQPLADLQRRQLAAMLAEVLPANAFYARKLAGLRFDALNDPLDRLPFTTRAELERDQADHPPYGTNLTYPLDRYLRFHQTSGSTGGRPMRWLDTAESWEWWKDCWRAIFQAAGVRGGQRVLLPFSFGPFIGFWSAFEAAASMGCMVLPAGGLTSSARLRMILDNQVQVVCCTPTYALRLAEVAQEEGIDLAGSAVESLIVAGEPGGSIPATRQRIESAWGARVFDHSGMTEAGPIAFECRQNPLGMHVMEDQFIAEVIDPATGQAVPDGQAGELVITNLGRWGSPLIRYRTGDQVRLKRGRCVCGRTLARLEGGILGRIDDMVCVRGVNVFPASVEAVVRRVAQVEEFAARLDESGPMPCLQIEIEVARGADGDATACKVARAIADALLLGAKVVAVPRGTLPRSEMKTRRVLRTTNAVVDHNRCQTCEPEVRSTCSDVSSQPSLSV